MIKLLLPLLGGKNERELHRIRPVVARINEIEDKLRLEPEQRLRGLTESWRRRLACYLPVGPAVHPGCLDEAGLRALAGSLDDRLATLRVEFPSLPREVIMPEPSSIDAALNALRGIEEEFADRRARYLDRILPEAYAVVKNAARRLCGREITVCDQPVTWDMVHFDVQLIGGIAIHRGMIAEMQTGEGKTLVATLPVYLNALTGLGVHVVTVNDYLARRDAEWMGGLFRFLGLSVGCLHNDMPAPERRAAYACDVTYGTNAEFGFDYLRDNGVATTTAQQVQRGHHFALIDEVDSILIDEARTPLIISMAAHGSARLMLAARAAVERLVRRQTQLCNQLAAGAERQLAAGDQDDAGTLLYQLKLGQPRHRRLLRLMEDPAIRRLIERTELSYQHGALRKDAFKLKENLFFVVNEKDRDADLMEKGRRLLAPDHPDAFTVPDLRQLLDAIDSDPALAGDRRAAAARDAAALTAGRTAGIHAVSQLLKAWCLHERDVHYVVRDGKVVIIDESTGREMPGRRWADGLHQAVEAKERVAVEEETRTCATVTIQNYFRLYQKIAGMTGTAETEAAEFHDIYGLDVLPMPTNAPNIRIDDKDQVFRTRREKFAAVVAKIGSLHAAGQPVLVGTASVDSSETLARMLKRARISHTVLNAKNHQREAEIIARAGMTGAVTVATNMAGRGTDIRLGDGVAALGGLFVIGTERHTSRRVDRQLRGRCARQGDPGRTQFFLSLEDDLMRTHASPDAMAAMIESAARNGSTRQSLGTVVEAAQRSVEQQGYKARKRILEFDDVLNLQRDIVYGHRAEVLAGDLPEPVRRQSLAVIDHHWQDHLDDMAELRDGVFLRAQGQKDPLVEYRNEAFALFQAMMKSVQAHLQLPA